MLRIKITRPSAWEGRSGDPGDERDVAESVCRRLVEEGRAELVEDLSDEKPSSAEAGTPSKGKGKP